MKGPWYLTEDQAAARAAKLARDFAAEARRCLVPGMPDDTVRMKLAARGYGAAELRRLMPLLGQSHG